MPDNTVCLHGNSRNTENSIVSMSGHGCKEQYIINVNNGEYPPFVWAHEELDAIHSVSQL